MEITYYCIFEPMTRWDNKYRILIPDLGIIAVLNGSLHEIYEQTQELAEIRINSAELLDDVVDSPSEMDTISAMVVPNGYLSSYIGALTLEVPESYGRKVIAGAAAGQTADSAADSGAGAVPAL